jgi:hypothetical protein
MWTNYDVVSQSTIYYYCSDIHERHHYLLYRFIATYGGLRYCNVQLYHE